MLTEIPDNRHWYVLITRPNAEKRVNLRLAETGFESYLPLRRQLRVWSDRKKWVEVPLFSSYIFVKTEERLRSRVFTAGGLVRYISTGGRAAVLSEEEIERVRRLCSYEGDFFIERGTLNPGDEVEIVEGHFAGLKGRILQTGGKSKLKISIAGLDCVAVVEIGKDIVRKID